ncbi:chemosensory receptor c [Plakobranchus ocellatus]|uniref:Chemosensory receptor c n=1 Tax=Plakobranchus ocellatus TaxID=259542 RepID=A0AAV4CX87_9GAST|nr:chemosensory receptor c [Plakobranchus ocellatus]
MAPLQTSAAQLVGKSPHNATMMLSSGGYLLTTSQMLFSLEILSFIQIPICLLGLISNIINIKVFLAMNAFNDGVTLTFLLLSVSDFCVCCSSLGLVIATIISSEEAKWLISLRGPSATPGKKLYMFSQIDPFFLSTFSIGFLQIFNVTTIVITFYLALTRCLCVVRPLKFRNVVSVKKTLRVVAISFISALLTRVPIMGHTGISMTFDLRINATRPRMWIHPRREIIKDIVWAGFDMPLCIAAQITLPVCIFIMLKGLTSAAKFRTQAMVSNDSCPAAQDAGKEKLNQKDIRVVQQMIFVSILFIVCNTPKLLTHIGTTVEPEFQIGAWQFCASPNMQHDSTRLHTCSMTARVSTHAVRQRASPRIQHVNARSR